MTAAYQPAVGDSPSGDITIVAVGASAGGLVALRALFSAAPDDPRIAYVVVTHLPS